MRRGRRSFCSSNSKQGSSEQPYEADRMYLNYILQKGTELGEATGWERSGVSGRCMRELRLEYRMSGFGP